MKRFIGTLILGIIAGCACMNYSIKTWNFPEYKNDTIIVNKVDSLIHDTVALKPTEIHCADKCVRIDTTYNITNGNITNKKINIYFGNTEYEMGRMQ